MIQLHHHDHARRDVHDRGGQPFITTIVLAPWFAVDLELITRPGAAITTSALEYYSIDTTTSINASDDRHRRYSPLGVASGYGHTCDVH